MNPFISTTFTLLLIYRAHSRSSLTPPAILAATITALIHSSHPTALPFTLLITFYLLGTTATKVKKAEKEKLTISSAGGHGEHAGRGVMQVLANSGMASVLAVIDLGIRKGWWLAGLGASGAEEWEGGWFAFMGVGVHGGWVRDLLLVGIIANYAATTADTLSSELGILSRSKPRLVLNPSKVCPPGTNGAVSAMGLLAGTAGAFIVAVVSSCWFTPGAISTPYFIAFVTGLGLAGSLLDSVLGAVFQLSVVDVRTFRVVENPHGGKVLVIPGETSFHPQHKHNMDEVEVVGGERARGGVQKRGNAAIAREGASRRVVQGGLGWLDNNGVNVCMAVAMSLVGMVAWRSLVGGIEY